MSGNKNEADWMEKEKKLEQMLRMELMEESNRILNEVASDNSLCDVSVSEEMEQALEKGIREFDEARASYERLSEEDKEALRLGKELLAQGRDTADVSKEEHSENVSGGKIIGFRKKRRKAFVLVVLAATLVLAIGMTSIGGAPFLLKIRQQLVGDREMVKVNTEREDDSNRNTDMWEEEKVFEMFKEKFGFTPVRLQYLPDGTELLEYGIDEDLLKGYLLYQCGKDIVEYRVILNYRDASYSYDVEEQIEDEYEMDINGQLIRIRQYLVAKETYAYMAEFEYKNAFYTINSMLEKSEFEKILKNLYFF